MYDVSYLVWFSGRLPCAYQNTVKGEGFTLGLLDWGSGIGLVNNMQKNRSGSYSCLADSTNQYQQIACCA